MANTALFGEVRSNPALQGRCAIKRRAAPLNLNVVNATGLRTALRRFDLGAELRHLADGSPRPGAEVHD